MEIDQPNAATAVRRETEARLAALPAEIATATRAVEAAAESTPGGRSNTKTFHVRSDAALRRTAQGFERLRSLERELEVLTALVARFRGLRERPAATAELLRDAVAIRVLDGRRLGGWTRVVKVNKVSVTIGGGLKVSMRKVADWKTVDET